MSDILEEIQELSNKFSNLFEVEGLGNPAVDVPPSQNKIKKDRKTKDGKVEVVSVEDELFPYEGNKREQYRQKILDTINNMIQGTATLEDLLQIVRQKKAPLKEAMEVLENLGSYIQNKYGDSKKGKELYDKYFQNFNKEANAAITKERAEDIEKKDKKPLEHYVKKLLDKRNETKNSKGEFKTDNRRDVIDQEYTNVNRESDPEGKKAVEKSLARHFDKVLYKPLKSQANITRKAVATEKFKRMNSEALEEAIELMEELLLERNKENKIKKNKAIEDIGQEYINGREEEGEDLEPYGDDPKQWGRDITSSTGDTLGVKRVIPKLADKLEHSGISELSRKLRKKPFYDKEGRNKIIDGLYLQALNKAKKENSKEALKEALSLMEAIINEISDKTANSFLEKRVINALDAWYNDDKLNKKEDDAVKALIKRKARQGAELSDDEKKRIGEASLTEEIINEVSVKKWKEAAKNSIEGRKEAASDASDRFGEVVYPFRGEVNDPGHKLGNAWDKAEQRADRAEQLAKNLPDSNKSAAKLKQAAKKVVDKRDKDNEEAVDKLQGAIDKLKEKPYDERTDKDYSDLAKVQNEWVDKQKKENQARNLVGKPERRPEKNSEGKHKLKEQGFIDRSKEA